MDILVTHVYDELRFIHYMQNKFHCSQYHAILSIESANKHGNSITITGLPECDVRYLQRNNSIYSEHFVATNKPICKLKITSWKQMKTKNPFKQMRPPIQPNSNKEESFKQKIDGSYKKATCIDISPQSDDEPKQEPLDLFHVTFTKIIHCDEMLNEIQIQMLLKDKHIKSISIEK